MEMEVVGVEGEREERGGREREKVEEKRVE